MSADSNRADPNAVAQFLSGKLAQVDVPAIERELKKLWQEAAGHDAEVEGRSVSRACALNLIMLTDRPEAEIAAGNLLDEIMLRHPCRAILVLSTGGDKAKIEAWVSARCHLPAPGSTKQICCEVISVRAEGQGAAALQSVVLPLIVPGLPVVLNWTSEHLDFLALGPFSRSIDRLIIDSTASRQGSPLFAEAAAFCQQKDHPAVLDLNWERLLHWRRLTAKVFDSLGLGLQVEDLARIEKARLEYAGSSLGQVGLFSGWLCGQLQWQALECTGRAAELSFKLNAGAGNAPVLTWAACAATDMPEGSLVKAEFTLAGRRCLTIELFDVDEKPELKASVTENGATGKEVVGRGPVLDETCLLCSQLDKLDRDIVLERALAMAAQLMNLLNAR